MLFKSMSIVLIQSIWIKKLIREQSLSANATVCFSVYQQIYDYNVYGKLVYMSMCTQSAVVRFSILYPIFYLSNHINSNDIGIEVISATDTHLVCLFEHQQLFVMIVFYNLAARVLHSQATVWFAMYAKSTGRAEQNKRNVQQGCR